MWTYSAYSQVNLKKVSGQKSWMVSSLEKNLSGDIGNIGGGVYITSTKVVTLKNAADYFREFIWWK